MSDFVLYSLIAVYGVVTLVVYMNFHFKSIYTICKHKLSNYTLGQMFLTIIFFPVELFSFIYRFPEKGLFHVLSKRPLRKFQYKIGDKVRVRGKIGTVSDVKLDDNFNEILQISEDSSGYWGLKNWYKTEEIEKVSPLEKLL